jgi:hypothetical protein|nr:MAG TPA: hypothetical protein [Caudoviricetes sp.]
MDKDQEKMNALFRLLDELLEYPIETSDDISDTELETYFQKFSQIYCNKFRHWYSLISDYLGKRTPDVYSTLDNGLRLIADYGKRIHPKSDEVNAGIDKLLDHVDLESVRIDRMEAVRCFTDETKNLYAATVQSSKEAQDKAKEVQKNVDHYHEQSISILGIFSAVVLAFMGGLSFSSSVLENFASVSMFRLIITIVLLGFVVFNALFILLRFVLHIVYSDPTKKKTSRGMIALNIALTAILAGTIGAYIFGAGPTIESWGATPEKTSTSTCEANS